MRKILSLVLFLMSYSPAMAEKILVITSYPRGVWTDLITSGLAKKLKKNHQLSYEYFHSEYWLRQSDAKRLVERERIFGVISTINPDYLLLVDDEILGFLGKGLGDIKKPIFLTGINSDESWINANTGLTQSRYSVVWESYPCQNGLKLLESLQVKVKKIGILTADLPTSEMIFKRCIEDLKVDKNVELAYTLKSSFLSDWLDPKITNNADADAVLILIPYGVNDVNGAEVPIEKLGPLLRKRIKVPIIGVLGVHTKVGLHAAFTIDAGELGLLSGQQILDFEMNKKLGQRSSAVAGAYEINETIWRAAYGKIPASYKGKRISSEGLKFGR